MKKYVLKRLLSLIPTIFIVSVVIFLLVHLTPGDPATAMLGEDATAAEIAALQTQLGLDDPLVVQYFRWVGNCLRLDFGTSTAVVNKPVSEMIASHFQPTILLAIYSQLITILIAIPCGMLAAKKRGTIADYFVSVLSMLGISLPSFLMGLGMVLLFAVNLRVLPAAGYKNPFTDGFLPFLRYMTLPAVSLGFIHAGYMMRMTKASMLEVLGSDYIKMARSKGVREWKIVTKHTFRNALLTVITVVGQGFISALAGAAVVERLFNIPGMGSLMVDSIEKRDYQVIQAITLLIAMLNVFINLIIDLIYGLADPRILWRHILPNILSPIIVQMTFTFATAIISEASLSFLGAGIPSPYPSWGGMLNEARGYVYMGWWMIVFPAIFTALSVLGFNLFGDGLRDLIDPLSGR